MSVTSDMQQRSVFFRWEEFCAPLLDVALAYFLWMMSEESAVSYTVDWAVGLCFAETVRKNITREAADRRWPQQREIPFRVIL